MNPCSTFTCLRCSDCCYFSDLREAPILLPHEVYYYKVLAKYLGVKLEFIQLESGLYKWVIKGHCPFYEHSTRTCKIHSEKPLACRMFPLLLDISEKKLMVSSLCSWVKKCLQVVTSINSEEDIVKLFPSEYGALRELVKILYSSESVIAIAVRGNSVKEQLNMLREKCIIIKILESSIIENLYLLILTNCSSDFVEGTLGLNNIEFMIEEKLTHQ